MRVEEIHLEPSTPPSAPPGTIADEGDAVPEPPGHEDEVERENTPEGDRTPDEFVAEEANNERDE